MTKFRRVRAGLYRDADSSYTIERQGASTARFDQANWFVKDANGTTQRVRQSYAEAEMAAHEIIEEQQ